VVGDVLNVTVDESGLVTVKFATSASGTYEQNAYSARADLKEY